MEKRYELVIRPLLRKSDSVSLNVSLNGSPGVGSLSFHPVQIGPYLQKRAAAATILTIVIPIHFLPVFRADVYIVNSVVR